MMRTLSWLWVLLFFFKGALAHATSNVSTDKPFSSSGFASFKAAEVNLRTGPGYRYPLRWAIRYKLLPVKILNHNDHWYEIMDPFGAKGWIHEALLSRQQTVCLCTSTPLHRQPDAQSPPLALLHPGALGVLKRTHQRWCYLTVIHNTQKYYGWVPCEKLWGPEGGHHTCLKVVPGKLRPSS